MWLRSRPSASDVLRIGRYAVERWKDVDGSLVQAGAHALPQDAAPHPQRLADAVRALYSGTSDVSATLVFESAWLPVVHVDVGASLLHPSQVEALVRHRFGLHHSDSIDPVATWELRIEHRAGSRWALAYGLPPRLKQTLLDVGVAARIKWIAMTPAMAWGMARLKAAKRWPKAARWLAWPEQDRTLLARFASDQVTSLNPGAPLEGDEAGMLRLVEIEGARLGLGGVTTDLIASGRWASLPGAARADKRLVWLELGNQRETQDLERSQALASSVSS